MDEICCIQQALANNHVRKLQDLGRKCSAWIDFFNLKFQFHPPWDIVIRERSSITSSAQNLGKPADVILERSLKLLFPKLTELMNGPYRSLWWTSHLVWSVWGPGSWSWSLRSRPWVWPGSRIVLWTIWSWSWSTRRSSILPWSRPTTKLWTRSGKSWTPSRGAWKYAKCQIVLLIWC